MADYFTSFACLFDVGTAENAARAEVIRQQQADVLDEAEGCDLGFDMQPDSNSGPGVLWISSDGSGEPEHVIAFALACAEAFDLSGYWAFTWALTCSRPRIDGFGGGAQLLDLSGRRSLSWVDTQHWIEEEIARRREPTNSAVGAFNPVEGAQGWTATTQADLLLSFVGQEIAADPAVAARFRTFLATVSAEPDEMLCRECGEPVFVTDAGISHHVGSGMDGIDHARDLAETRSVCGCDHTALPEKEA